MCRRGSCRVHRSGGSGRTLSRERRRVGDGVDPPYAAGLTARMQPDTAALKEQFNRIFGPRRGTDRAHVVRAPGRVNLIGEHTDYNDGFVFPMAIEPEVRIVCRSRNDGTVRLASTAFPGQTVEFSVQKKIPRNPHGAWDNYSRGVAAEMLAAGIPLVGMDALISNTLPVGGGLSSSAA